MRNSYNIIEIDNYVILNTLQNFHFQEYSIFAYQFGLKTCQTNFGKTFKTNTIFITKYLNYYWNIVKSYTFY